MGCQEVDWILRLTEEATLRLKRYTAVCMDSVGHQSAQKLAIPKKGRVTKSWQKRALDMLHSLKVKSQHTITPVDEGWRCTKCMLGVE